MILKRFRRRLRNYGFKRLLTSADLIVGLLFTLALFGIQKLTHTTDNFINITFINFDFIDGLIPILGALTSFVITGLAVLVSVTNEDFLGEISDLGIYPNILFMFEFNILLLGWTAILAVILTTYEVPSNLFYIFLFFFAYSMLSLTELMQLIVNTGLNKARYEGQKSNRD